VGIPTFNRPEGVRRTLGAITRQTYPSLEIIVSDNASPEHQTEDVIAEFAERDPRIRFHRQTHNIGAGANFQFVLSQAKGRYFMWAADDDDWEPSFIERCVAGFDRPDVVSVMSQFRTHYRRSGRLVSQSLADLDPERSRLHNLLAFLRMPTPTLLYGLHLLECLRFCEPEQPWFDFYDCYFALRLLSVGKIRLVPEVLHIAGVDSDEYLVKPVSAGRWLSLSYGPFFRACREAIAASDLSPGDKALVAGALALTTARLFFYHEIRNRF
jgi:glycosyltransferase involved in cell wall biosynthesis